MPPFHRWLNKLGLASIQYEATERSAAAGEHLYLKRIPTYPTYFVCRLVNCGFLHLLNNNLCVQSVTVKPVTMKRLRPRISHLRRTPNRRLRAPWMPPVLLAARTRSVLSPFLVTIRLAAGPWESLRWPSLSHRELCLRLTPPRWPAKPPVRSRRPSARWRRRAPPPQWPSTDSPGWTWSRRRRLPPRRRPWCVWLRCTRISLRETRGTRRRRRRFRRWRAQLRRSFQKRRLMMKVLPRRWSHRLMLYMFRIKVRFHWNSFTWLDLQLFILHNWFDIFSTSVFKLLLILIPAALLHVMVKHCLCSL